MQALTLITIGRPLPLSAKTERPFFGQKKRPRLVEAAVHQGRIISAPHRSKANYTFFSCSVLNVMNEPDLRINQKKPWRNFYASAVCYFVTLADATQTGKQVVNVSNQTRVHATMFV